MGTARRGDLVVAAQLEATSQRDLHPRLPVARELPSLRRVPRRYRQPAPILLQGRGGLEFPPQEKRGAALGGQKGSSKSCHRNHKLLTPLPTEGFRTSEAPGRSEKLNPS